MNIGIMIVPAGFIFWLMRAEVITTVSVPMSTRAQYPIMDIHIVPEKAITSPPPLRNRSSMAMLR